MSKHYPIAGLPQLMQLAPIPYLHTKVRTFDFGLNTLHHQSKNQIDPLIFCH
ncbi:hypothetical protein [Bartonella queenslandensis]|uniref:hypothetical protein n=1 Tax=Bartonella queenslandensis TaxID=481138 RepID=UPI001BA4B0C9|nr:hypothetical protein [Bartonella queenslandensis]